MRHREDVTLIGAQGWIRSGRNQQQYREHEDSTQRDGTARTKVYGTACKQQFHFSSVGQHANSNSTSASSVGQHASVQQPVPDIVCILTHMEPPQRLDLLAAQMDMLLGLRTALDSNPAVIVVCLQQAGANLAITPMDTLLLETLGTHNDL